MSQTQIRGNKQIRSGSITNTEIASDANIALSKIAGGTELNNRVTDLESDAFVTREVPSGSVNGSNVTFTLANTPVAGSEQVYLNGLLQDPGAGNSYTIVGSTITFLSPPLTNDEIHVSYATGNYMVAPGGAGGSGSIEIVEMTTFTHPEQATYATYAEYTFVHNMGKNPNYVECVFTHVNGQKINVFHGGGARNDYWVSTDLNTIKLYLVRFGGGLSEYTLTPKLYFFEEVSNGGGGISPFVWSTSEQVYPLEKGVGGVTLYAKEVDFGALPASGLKAVAHNITGLTSSKVHRMESFLRSNSSSVIFGEIQSAPNQGWGSMVSYLTSTNCVIEVSANWSSHNAVFRIIYSK